MTRAAFLVALLMLGTLAGCIELPQELREDASASSAQAPPRSERVDGMTVETNEAEDTVAPCPDGGPRIPPGAYCATRLLTVSGRIGLDELPVTLLTLNGDVTLQRSAGDAWSFHATVKTRGMTEEEARRALDETWTWSHADGARHHLHAAPNASVPLLTGQFQSAEYRVALPAWVLLDLTVESTNGDLEVLDVPSRDARLSTTNGDVTLRGEGANAAARTTNGDVELDLTTTETGSIEVKTTNGEIEVRLLESEQRGYDLDARTTNGRVTVELRDGDLGKDEKTHKTFRTRGYDHRSVRTSVSLVTTNGDVGVTP